MSEMTIFLAQIIGPTLGLIGLGMLLNPKFYAKIVKSFGSEENFDMMVTPMLMIAVGVVMVMKHFVWTSFPEGLISLIGLAMLIKGGMMALMPTVFKSIVRALPIKGMLMVGGLFWLAGGAYLSYVGFM